MRLSLLHNNFIPCNSSTAYTILHYSSIESQFLFLCDKNYNSLGTNQSVKSFLIILKQ